YAAALDRVFGDDPTDYLVRRVELHWAANLATFPAGADLARRWGERLAAAVVRAIARDSGDGNVISFPSSTAHVAAFVEELLAGRPADDWTFAAFASQRRASARDTLRAVLLDHACDFGAIAARLQQAGVLSRLLDTLEGETLARLWAEGVAKLPAPSPDA